jgi:hypothetical protein
LYLAVVSTARHSEQAAGVRGEGRDVCTDIGSVSLHNHGPGPRGNSRSASRQKQKRFDNLCDDRGWLPNSLISSAETSTAIEAGLAARQTGSDVHRRCHDRPVAWPPKIGELLPSVDDAYGVHEKLGDIR